MHRRPAFPPLHSSLLPQLQTLMQLNMLGTLRSRLMPLPEDLLLLLPMEDPPLTTVLLHLLMVLRRVLGGWDRQDQAHSKVLQSLEDMIAMMTDVVVADMVEETIVTVGETIGEIVGAVTGIVMGGMEEAVEIEIVILEETVAVMTVEVAIAPVVGEMSAKEGRQEEVKVFVEDRAPEARVDEADFKNVGLLLVQDSVDRRGMIKSKFEKLFLFKEFH